ncbi:uncharacterized protein LOC108911299 [Anoplophora glabripennis]|uniref:uncharacterized protein LOC108911299 n=1 Tax=Anoplophora glabripennis TaxID=217634 RepID=UPI0008748B13|nr:uncharacterized protein LOC108911299 [Anoplophora glabripennis]
MDPNCANMTGEPNQANRSSVFGFDPYPPPYVNWSQPDVFTNPVTQFRPGPSLQQPQLCMPNTGGPSFPVQGLPEQQVGIPNAVPQFTMTSLPQQQVNFSFGAPRPTQDVVQFPFQIACHGFGQRTIPSIRCKRKTDSPPLQPVKQHITEEKMAEHMSKLHISSESVGSSKESDSDRTQRLYMCEEMRKLQTDSLLPQSLIARIQRPCTALVLWKPPTRILPLVNNDIDENENNNEQQQPDNNVPNESEMENDLNNMDMDNC